MGSRLQGGGAGVPRALLPAAAQEDMVESVWDDQRPRGRREQPRRHHPLYPKPPPQPPPSAVGCVAPQKDEEEETTIQSILEESGTPLGYRGGAAGKDLNRVEEQTPRAPWAAALSSPWLRISSFLSKRVEVTVFLSQLMNRFWVAGVTIETGAILSK